ncbi:MAG: putative quinol monooxygenase [Anaerolineae bacterium]
MNPHAKFIAITKATAKPGHLDPVAQLFAETNPDLVKDQPDWLEAVFSADPVTNEITVLAFWASDESYRLFSSSPAFRSTMGQFAQHLAGPPVVSVSSVLVGMTQDSVWSFSI